VIADGIESSGKEEAEAKSDDGQKEREKGREAARRKRESKLYAEVLVNGYRLGSGSQFDNLGELERLLNMTLSAKDWLRLVEDRAARNPEGGKDRR